MASKKRKVEDLTVSVVFDIGSSSVRAAAFRIQHKTQPELLDWHGKPCSLNEHGEADADSIISLLEECLDSCLSTLRCKYQNNEMRIESIGFTSFAMSFMGVDADGLPVTPLFTYARRGDNSEVSVNALRNALGVETLQKLYHETGVPIHAAYAPALIYQLSQENPSLLDKVISWQTIGSWIIGKWCGLMITPISTCEASWLGLLNLRSGQWHYDLCQILGLNMEHEINETSTFKNETSSLSKTKIISICSGNLPKLCNFNDRFELDYFSIGGNSTKEKEYASKFAVRWPELTHAKVYLPIGDGAAAALGSGCDGTAQRISLTVGTSAAVRLVFHLSSSLPSLCYRDSKGGTDMTTTTKTTAQAVLQEATSIDEANNGEDSFVIPSGLWCYRIDSERVILGGALTDGGSYLQFLADLLYDGDLNTAMQQASKEDSTKLRLQMLPFLGPERSPGWHGNAFGAIVGLRRGTSRAQLMRGGVDAVAAQVGIILDSMDLHFPHLARWPLFASGGAIAKSELWKTTLANVTGRTLVINGDSAELTLKGVALAISSSYSNKSTIDEGGTSPLPDQSIPNHHLSSFYTKLKDEQRNLYSKLLAPSSDFALHYHNTT